MFALDLLYDTADSIGLIFETGLKLYFIVLGTLAFAVMMKASEK